MRRQSPAQDFSTVLSPATRFVIRGSLLALLAIMPLTNAQAHPPNTSWWNVQPHPGSAAPSFSMQCTNSNASASGVTHIGIPGGYIKIANIHEEVHTLVDTLLTQFALPTSNSAGQPAQMYNVGPRTIQMPAWAPIDPCQPVMCTLTLDPNVFSNDWGNGQPIYSPSEWNDIHSHGPFSIYEPAVGSCNGVDVKCCPPWDQTRLGSMLDDVPPAASGPPQRYVNRLTPTASINTQMQAFADYAKALNPNVESMNLAFAMMKCGHDSQTPPNLGSGCALNWIGDTKLISWQAGATVVPSVYASLDILGNWDATLSATDVLRDPDQISDPNNWYILWSVPVIRYQDGSFMVPEDCPIVYVQINHKYAFKKGKFSDARQLLRDVRTTSRAELDAAPGGRELEALLQRLSETKGSPSTEWTPWLNRDRQSGKGDYETLTEHRKNGAACENPSEVQCRTTRSKEDWSLTGETYHCSVEAGGYCNNRDQSDRRCQDYEVRFMCPVD